MKTVQLLFGLALLANTALAVKAGNGAHGGWVAFWAFVTFANALGGTLHTLAALIGPAGLVLDTDRWVTLRDARGQHELPLRDRDRVRLTHPSDALVARGAKPRVRYGAALRRHA